MSSLKELINSSEMCDVGGFIQPDYGPSWSHKNLMLVSLQIHTKRCCNVTTLNFTHSFGLANNTAASYHLIKLNVLIEREQLTMAMLLHC